MYDINNVYIKDIIIFLKENCYEYEFIGNINESVNGFSSLFNYKKKTITFIVPERNFNDYQDAFKNCKITLIITHKSEQTYNIFKNVIKVDDPRKVFFEIVENFFNKQKDESITGISSNPKIYNKNSYIADEAKIGNNVKIGIGCVIEGNVIIGENTEIHHNVVIRNKTRIGINCTILSGTKIGEPGFNYTIDKSGFRHMIKHYGGVKIEDNVHIGDNCCIIRGAIDDTVIKNGAKLNTMVHVAHNALIGQNTIITAPTHICGSVNIGENSHIAANIIRNQLTVGKNATLGLGAVVVKDVEEGDTVVGNPAKSMITE